MSAVEREYSATMPRRPPYLYLAGAMSVGTERIGSGRFSTWPEAGIGVVAAGTGSFSGGGLAAELAVELLPSLLRRGTAAEGRPRLRDAASKVSERIAAAAQLDGFLTGMGATLAVCWLEGERLLVGHVGDSRAYRLRSGALKQLTEDHVLDAAVAQRPLLTRGLGVEPSEGIDVREVEPRHGDVLLLCTDGVHRALSQEELVEIVGERTPVDQAARKLVETAEASARRGDRACVVARVDW